MSAAASATAARRRLQAQDKKKSKRKKDETIPENISPNDNPGNVHSELVDHRHDSSVKLEHSRWAQFRQLSGHIVNEYWVQVFILFLIVSNSIFMGVGTFDFVTEDNETQRLFEIIDKVFLITFTVELGLQIIYHGIKIFLDGWLFFDFAVVMLSWASDFMDGTNLQVMRAFRVFRALRLITRVKVMKDLVSALLKTLPNMSAIVFLLGIVHYIFAVMFTSLYKNLDEVEGVDEDVVKSFSTLSESFFTLFQMMTLDGWSDVCRELMIFQPSAWLPVIIFVIITAFVFMNLVIAVLCDAVSHTDEEDEEDRINASLREEDRNMERSSTSDISDNFDEDSISSHHERIDALFSVVKEIQTDQQELRGTIEFLIRAIKNHPTYSLKNESQK